MALLPRRVFSLIRDNAPKAGSVIENPTLASQGYGMTFYAMGADTSTPAERLQKPSLYMVLTGELLVEVHDQQPYRTVVLKPGEVFVRHADILIGFRAQNDCIFMEQSFRDSVDFVEAIDFKEVIKLDEWVSLSGLESYRTFLDGWALFGQFYGFPKGTQFDSKITRGCVLFICLEGQIEYETEDGRKYEMHPWDAVFLRRNRYPHIKVTATQDSRALRLLKLY